MTVSITHIIERCAVGDEKSYRALVDVMSPYLMTTACRYVSYDDAKDVLQDSFINLFKALKKTTLEQGKESAYIHKIVVNNCLKRIRKKKLDFKLQDKFSTLEIEKPLALETLESSYILRLLSNLPDACRLCFQLYEIDGYSHKEIGEKLNITSSTSRANLSRAKKILQRNILANQRKLSIKLERHE